MLKLGTNVTDSSTNQEGMLTLYQLEAGEIEFYFFQPRGLSPKTGEPLEGRWITEGFVNNGIEDENPIEIPSIIGSVATDNASGYSGIVINLKMHLNGCIHAAVQSTEILTETGSVPNAVDFDIRRLSGDSIPVLDEDELEDSKVSTPSPLSIKGYRPR